MKTIITVIRMAIGWHFLYEGSIKLFAQNWSAESFLNNSQSFLSGFYHWLAASPGRLAVIDFLNVWGLVLIGLALFLGVFARWASLAGALLLALYYFAYPPFGISLLGSDGTVYVINQLFIEAAILIFLFCYNERGYGLDDAIHLLRKRKKTATAPAETSASVNTRRELLKDLVTLPVLGVAGWGAYRSHRLYGADVMSGATIQVNQVALGELKGELPKGKLGNHELSRLILGGNLLDGTAHARDLLYVSSLFKSYNTEKKVFETLTLCEQAGINCIAVSDWVVHSKILNKYKQLTGSKIKILNYFIFGEDSKKNDEGLKKAVDLGVDIIQVHGTISDRMVLNNRIEVIGDLLNLIRRNGVVAGLGAHTIDALIVCEQNGIIPDYYKKTMHHDNYWSAHPRENRKAFEMSMPDRLKSDHNMWHDNLFDTFPDRTVEFINRTKIPVIGFKVLAGGAIHPKDGFKYAFENGADFICVGMFDFQVVDDVNICIDTLNNLTNRQREWYG
ncbi:hypothetical protein FACS189464_3020 [Bacteroidia bacterium]|nr:hypothetical protein FACS189430_00060 [Bacteroidia bacterium]GHT78869.1 hypothetical protein FACS189464_3020 [Bacteroidia bacterium]